jgi:hypothetical protein
MRNGIQIIHERFDHAGPALGELDSSNCRVVIKVNMFRDSGLQVVSGTISVPDA